MSTSYGDVEPIGSVAKSQPEPAKGSYVPQDDNTGISDQDREEAAQVVKEVKEDITAPTGDIDQDLEQLNVEELLENVADPKQFGKRGEPLFFGQLLFLILIFFPPTFFKTLVTSLGLLATIGGIFVAFVGVRDLGSNFYPFTSARPGNKLVTKGFFRYVRHPMYCGLCALTFGLCAITGSQARLALSVGFWLLMNHKADLEEAEMERVHGEQYTEYKSHVSKLIPGIF